MRLLWLIDSLNVGGAESLVLPFAARVEDLTVCCLKTTGENLIEQELRRRGVEVLNLESRNLRDRAAFRRLMQIVRERRIELVHAHLTYSAIWSALLSRRTGVPSIVSLHVAPTATKRLESSRLQRMIAIDVKDRLMRSLVNRWSRRVIFVSEALRDFYGDAFDAAKVRVVHNGIEVERFHRDPVGTRERLAVAVSVLRAGKGIEILLDAIERVPDTSLLIVGDGPKRAEWESLTNNTRVRWAGYRTDVDAILARCDLFVHPTLEDAFPTVLLEAMAASLPVVASRVGGIPEIVEDGVTGILVPPGDASALAIAMQSVEPSMGVAGRKRAERLFSIETWIARLQDVYREAL